LDGRDSALKRRSKAKTNHLKNELPPKIIVNNNITNSMLIGHDSLSKIMEKYMVKDSKKKKPSSRAEDLKKKTELGPKGKFLKYKAKVNRYEDPPSTLMNDALLERVSKMLS